jgi:hypothetical protein
MSDPKVTGSPDEIYLVYGDIERDATHEEVWRHGDIGWSESRVYRSDVKYVRADRIEALEEELRLTDKLLESRDQVLKVIPACLDHGHSCVPHAIEWVQGAIVRIEQLERELAEATKRCREIIECSELKLSIPTDTMEQWAARHFDRGFARGVAETLRKQEIALKAQSEPVAWRVQVGDSNIWGYVENESDADFHGKLSGLKYKKQSLYTTPQPSAEDAKDAARYRWLRGHPDFEVSPAFKKGKIVGFTAKPYGCTEYYRYESIDAAIDAARGEG